MSATKRPKKPDCPFCAMGRYLHGKSYHCREHTDGPERTPITIIKTHRRISTVDQREADEDGTGPRSRRPT